jgi:putative peptidoglycan lipid II flippase
VVGAGILAGNITGFFRVVVTAWFLGTHARADALAVALGPIDTLTTAFINTMLVAFVPMLMLSRPGEREAVFEQAARIFALILACATACIFLLAPELISILGPGLAAEQHQQAVHLLQMFSPAIFFGGSSAIFAALLYTERRFIAPAFYQTCVNGGTILGALALWKIMGVYGFAIGYSAGAALQLGLTWSLSRDLRVLSETGRQAAPLRHILLKPFLFLLYASLISANILVTRAFATHAGPGMAASLDYCLKCLSVVVAYMVYPVANSLLPEIARLKGERQAAQAYRLIYRSVAMMAVCSVVACLVGVAVRTPVISLLFERGSFTPDSTKLVSMVFLGFAPSIVGWTLLDLVSRCFFALDRPKRPVAAAFVPVTMNLAIMALAGRTANPVLLGLAPSVGLASGFLALFALANVRGRIPSPVEEAVEVA